MKFEIIRKPIVLERVEVNLLKSSHCYLQRVTTRYRHFFKKDININFFYKFGSSAYIMAYPC